MNGSSSPSISGFIPGPQPVKRNVVPELLDSLPPDHAAGLRSRKDLRRLNWLMGHAAIIASTLTTRLKRPPRTIAEIGAGDGTLMLKLASRMRVRWPRVGAILVDRQSVTTNSTAERIRGMGWQCETVEADAFEWLAAKSSAADVVLANLFLHHFEDEKLKLLFRSLADRTDLFVACETRREWLSSAASHLIGLIGCNSVTQHDAFISVNAGFVAKEISALWPHSGWDLSERRTGWFTHQFVAQRRP